MNTYVSRASSEQLRTAKELIKQGETVAFHTETVYGLGANAFDDDAVQKIFALKGRPADNPLIVHVHKRYDISRLIDRDPPYCAALRSAFLPGPLTMVYPSTGKVSRFVSCGLDTLAIRVPKSDTAQAFLRAVDLPIAAPSANLSKHVSPVTAWHVFDDFKGKIPLILDGGPSDGGIESTVLDCTGDVPQILREGLVTREMIASVAGACGIYVPAEGEPPRSPGMAYKHYAPRCETFYCTDPETALARYRKEKAKKGKPRILCASKHAETLPPDIAVLDLGDTPELMAHRLYDLLRKGETEGTTLLIGIEPEEKDGIMAGVLNRFRRAFGVLS